MLWNVVTIYTTKMQDYISGIQQIGIGVADAQKSLHEYSNWFGMSTLVFDDISEASLMTRYTGGQAYKRQALLSLNMKGGGGFEIWQFQNRSPSVPQVEPVYGDLGIFAPKLKCADIETAHRCFLKHAELEVSTLQKDEKGEDAILGERSAQQLF